MNGLAAEAASPTSSLLPASRLAGEIIVPADKSIAHRALIMGALAAGDTTVVLRHPGEDVLSTASALRSLGVAVDEVDARDARDDRDARDGRDGRVRLAVRGLGSGAGAGSIGGGEADCGNSGTTMRLLAGARAGGSGRAVLTGDASLRTRPMDRVAHPLRAMGALVETTNGHAPLVIEGRRPLRALEHELPIASAQVLGAVALAALSADGRTRIRVPGPTRDHTERMLAGRGVTISREAIGDGATLTTLEGPAAPRAGDVSVPGDFSAAAAWIVAATIHPDAEVALAGVGLNPTRTALLDVLREMGADIELRPATNEAGEPVGDVVVRSGSQLRGVSVGARQVPALIDELPLLAVAMAAANGTSEVRGATELRVKESDRIAAMAAALAAAGARIEELPDGWRIGRGKPRQAAITTHGDHRIAMAMAVAAWSGVAAGAVLDDPACVAVSYPTFWIDGARIGANR